VEEHRKALACCARKHSVAVAREAQELREELLAHGPLEDNVVAGGGGHVGECSACGANHL
jgi:hypothetical protein